MTTEIIEFLGHTQRERGRERAMDCEAKEEKSSIVFDASKIDDPYAFLSLSRNPDGSFTRLVHFPDVTPNTLPPPPSQQALPYVLSKDIPLNPSNHTRIRIYRPYLLSTPTTPLPVIIYFHGGGFIVGSSATSFSHEFCERLAIQVPAIVLSVDYRLAPEHRLPAAYDDGMDAVRWLKEQAGGEPWMAPEIADFSSCFLMGCSSGGTIAYYLWRQLEAAAESEKHPTFKIAGAILEQPLFGGVERTESELRMARDHVLPLPATDLMWELALPVGADRDHEYSNPETLEKKKLGGGWGKQSPCLLLASSKDPLVDRQRAMMKMVEEKGVKVVKVVGKLVEEGGHCSQLFEEDKKEMWLKELKDFVSSVITC